LRVANLVVGLALYHGRRGGRAGGAERAAANQQRAGFEHFAPVALETASHHNLVAGIF